MWNEKLYEFISLIDCEASYEIPLKQEFLEEFVATTFMVQRVILEDGVIFRSVNYAGVIFYVWRRFGACELEIVSREYALMERKVDFENSVPEVVIVEKGTIH